MSSSGTVKFPQNPDGKFTLDLRGLRDLRDRLKKAESHQIDIGHLKKEWMKDRALYLHELAAIHHFGHVTSKGMYHPPPRPYINKGLERIAKDSNFWRKVGETLITGKVRNTKSTLSGLFKSYGMKARDELKKSIKLDYIGLRRNKVSTILRKGSTVPMVDTGDLVNNISFRISSRKLGSSKKSKVR